jgi:phosphatidylserine/phosphatidylglycerophosphate/cardiolipin synthase-like enzyme
MNENASLYTQDIEYLYASAPYQCLTLPWWVRAPYEVYYPRHRCQLEPINCGEKVFARIMEDIEAAQKSVEIITWGFDPGMVLVRDANGDGIRYGELLERIAKRANNPVEVRLVVWHDQVFSESVMHNMPGYYCNLWAKLGSSSNQYYSEEHQDFNVSWFKKVLADDIPSLYLHTRSVPMLNNAFSLEGEKLPELGLKGKAAKAFPSHHQKMVLIDYETPQRAVGYVMGHNSITDFWDTAQHRFRDPRRERVFSADPGEAWKQSVDYADCKIETFGRRPTEAELAKKARAVQRFLDQNSRRAKPFQDVSMRLRGPILYDLNHNFSDAWEPSHAYGSESRKPQVEANRGLLPRRAQIPLSAFRLPDGCHSAQLLRTDPIKRHKAIKECYANLTRQMHHYMFIQNQYIQYEPWAEHLKECVQRLRDAGSTKPVYVFILTSTPESNGMDTQTYDVASKLGCSKQMTYEHAEHVELAKQGKQRMPLTEEALKKAGINVVMGSMWTSASNPSKASDYEEIYIHAKVAIVDDAAFTLGSANLNIRSMAMDGELNVLCDSKEVSYRLRCELFNQVAREEGPATFGDMGKTYRDWKTLMTKNLSNRAKRQPLVGFLFPFEVSRKPAAPVI